MSSSATEYNMQAMRSVLKTNEESYCQTELGLLPADWRVVQIGESNPFVTSGSRGWAQFYSKDGHPFVRITNLSRDSIDLDLSDLKLVSLPSQAQAEALRTALRDGDLLISITADIGIIGIVGSTLPKPAFINQHIALIRFDQSLIVSRFAAYSLASERPQKLFLASMDVGAKAGMSLLTVRKIQLPLPPPDEQRAIAAALSDVDALLVALDELIAKKRAVKQATMQQLLTGSTRLPGYKGEWEAKLLEEIADVLKGFGLSKNVIGDTGNRKCILYGELFTTYGTVIREAVSRTYSRAGRLSRSGDILIPGSTTTTGVDLAKASAILEDGVAIGGDVNIIRLHNPRKAIPEFLAMYLTEVKKGDIAERAQGITIIHLYGRDLLDLELHLPSLAEQQAIATILMDMDTEIDLLERRREKTREIKQGMMQQLLTGRIRLLHPTKAGGEP